MIRDQARARASATPSLRPTHQRYGVDVAENEAILDAAKDHPCVDCDHQFPACAMHFDHLRDKLFTIAHWWWRVTAAELRAEIAKCELVCANCHSIRTKLRWWIARTNGNDQ